jgi:radical SAM superfamily enzyme YgiQ (UPF0313 family)
MKVTFVDNFYYVREHNRVTVQISPHLGLMTLATILRDAGHVVSIFDPKILFDDERWGLPDEAFLDAWAQRLLDARPDVLGFTALGRTLPYVVRVAERVKRARPAQVIVVGGPHATIVGEPLLREFPCFDVVVRYEAEPHIVDLVQRLGRGAALDDIPNLVIRKGADLESTLRISMLPNMDSLPRPALDLYPDSRVRSTDMALEAGRGCPFACTFCSTANFFERRYRLKSNDRLIEEMEEARGRYGVHVFNLNHDLFGLNKKVLRDFCQRVAGRGFEWKCSMRPDTLDVDMLGELAAAGCVDIYFGVETGSERMQKVTKKKLDLAPTRSTVSQVVAAGLTCTTSFITGFPEEASEDQDATLDMVGDMLATHPLRVRVQLHILSPEPGSEMACRPQTILFDGIGPELDDLVDHELLLKSPEVFSVFYHFRTQLPRWRVVMASAFVTYLVPELGTSLVVHLRDTVFGGSLARMFDAVVPDDPGPCERYENVVQLLWSGVERAARALVYSHPHFLELVRFARVMSWAHEREGRTLKTEDETPLVALARFGVDAPAMARQVLTAPRKALPPELMRPGTRWTMFHRGEDGQVSVAPVDARFWPAIEQRVSMLADTGVEGVHPVEILRGMQLLVSRPEGLEFLLA